VPPRAIPHILLNHAREMWSNLVPTMVSRRLPVDDVPPGTPSFIRYTWNADQVERLARYGRARGATLNDLLVAAYARMHHRLAVNEGAPLRITMTVDLRRYLPGERGEGVCSLSQFEFVNLGSDPGPDFEATLARVSAITRARKRSWFGCNRYPTIPVLRVLPFRWQAAVVNAMMPMIPPGLTNMGPIRPERVTFGTPPVSAWLLTPPVFPPLFVCGLSGYQGTLTMSAGYYTEAMTRVSAETVFDAVRAELPE
jgi:NRPS condensation-like uncharacterized protein